MLCITPRDVEELRAQAEGSRPFGGVNKLYERLAELDEYEYKKLDSVSRLALGYYLAAKRRSDSLKEVA
jgi:hypothetical protein